SRPNAPSLIWAGPRRAGCRSDAAAPVAAGRLGCRPDARATHSIGKDPDDPPRTKLRRRRQPAHAADLRRSLRIALRVHAEPAEAGPPTTGACAIRRGW